MPYYSAMGDYYRGDNYAAGGIGSFFGGLIKKVAGTALSLTPAGGVVKALIPSLGSGGSTVVGTPRPLVPVPGLTGFGQRLVPGGASGFMLGPSHRRRMNPLNIKALRRAMRRAKGFERQARRVGSFFNPGKTFRLKGRRRRKS